MIVVHGMHDLVEHLSAVSLRQAFPWHASQRIRLLANDDVQHLAFARLQNQKQLLACLEGVVELHDARMAALSGLLVANRRFKSSIKVID